MLPLRWFYLVLKYLIESSILAVFLSWQGATPKDGPSAGAAITTAIISIATNQTLPTELVQWTGEISLSGKNPEKSVVWKKSC